MKTHKKSVPRWNFSVNKRTIEINLESVHSDKTLPAWDISTDDVLSLLLIRTRKTVFKHDNKWRLQVEGFLISSPTGPTSTYFCNAHMKNTLLSQTKASNWSLYVIYVDDTFYIFNEQRYERCIPQRLESSSILIFTI